MPVWNDCKMASLEEAQQIRCSVRCEPQISISFTDPGRGPASHVQIAGTAGHFVLSGPRGCRATLHWPPGAQQLTAYWSEDGHHGMWCIELGRSAECEEPALWDECLLSSYCFDEYAVTNHPCCTELTEDYLRIRFHDEYFRCPVEYLGRNDGDGHFILLGSDGGSATLHQHPDSAHLDGFWHVAGYCGMWRISLPA